MSVFISYGCNNKCPQLCWLKTTEIYSLTVLGVKTQNQGVIFPPQAQGRICFSSFFPTACQFLAGFGDSVSSSFFWWLPAPLGLRLHPSSLCLHLHITFSSLSICVFSSSASSLLLHPSYKDTCDHIYGPAWLLQDKLLLPKSLI